MGSSPIHLRPRAHIAVLVRAREKTFISRIRVSPRLPLSSQPPDLPQTYVLTTVHLDATLDGTCPANHACSALDVLDDLSSSSSSSSAGIGTLDAKSRSDTGVSVVKCSCSADMPSKNTATPGRRGS